MNIVPQDTDENESSGRLSSGGDLPDSQHDEERMKPEEVVIDLPDVNDIPGQEHIHVPSLGILADTTISSDDEEGIGLFDDETEEDADLIMGTEADNSNTVKDPNEWTTGSESMTGAQKSYLKTLSDEAGEPFDENLSKAEASIRINELQQKTGRGVDR